MKATTIWNDEAAEVARKLGEALIEETDLLERLEVVSARKALLMSDARALRATRPLAKHIDDSADPKE